jgi:hypothetical protein
MISANRGISEPSLIFFRKVPVLAGRDPLASCLQNFETSLLLLSMDRYPNALVTCVSAIESCLKAILNINDNQRGDQFELAGLIDKIIIKNPGFEPCPRSVLKAMRDGRNRIVHFGFSPKDDDTSVELILKAGLPYLRECLNTFMDIDLYDSLFQEFAGQLRTAEKAYALIRNSPNIPTYYCLLGVRHLVWWSLHQGMMPKWQAQMIDSDSIDGLDVRMKSREAIKNTMKVPWVFTCPICDEAESLVCEMHDVPLDSCIISIERGRCVNCRFVLPKGATFLADLLCQTTIEEETPKILKDLGLDSP